MLAGIASAASNAGYAHTSAVFALGLWWPAALAVGAAILDCGLRATLVANQTTINSIAPDARSRSNTVFGISVWSGNALGAFLASLALAHSGWIAVCVLSAVAAATALAVQLTSMRKSARRQDVRADVRD